VRHNGQASIWCDKPQAYGIIPLQPDDLQCWQVNPHALANTIAGLLEMQDAQCLLPQRIYDLGVWQGHTLFLVCGITWEDAQQCCNDTRIRHSKPLILTLSPAPNWLTMPHIEAGRILRVVDDVLKLDTSRLHLVAGRDAPKSNVFHRQGDML
jgi:hypothetical protein